MHSGQFLTLFVVFTSVLGLAHCRLQDSEYENAILFTQNTNFSHEMCTLHIDGFGSLAKTRSLAVEIGLSNYVFDWTGCDELANRTEYDLKGQIVLLNGGNCTLAERARNVHETEAAGYILAASSLGEITKGNESEGLENITATLVGLENFKILENMGENASVWLYGFNDDKALLEPESFLLLSIAILTVIFGSTWSGITRHKEEEKARIAAATPKTPGSQSQPSQRGSSYGPMQNRPGFSVSYVIWIVVIMSCILVLLYFFYDYIVYVLLASFILGSVVSLFSNLSPIVKLVPIKVFIPIRSFKIDVRDVFLLVVALTVTIVWIVFRKQFMDIWILQNIMCLSFVIFAIRFLRLPNLKIILILSILLFIYDCFFVFVTPYLISAFPLAASSNYQSDGESVMVKVAKNAIHGDEPLPIAIVIPRMFSKANICALREFSLLGSGDMAVPGMVLAYYKTFDLRLEGMRLYYPIAVMGYSFGLIMAHVALTLSRSPQPALFYIIPMILLPVMIVSAIRKDFGTMWKDQIQGPKSQPKPDEENGAAGDEEAAGQQTNGNAVSVSSSNTSNLAENSSLLPPSN